jgi:hypothetical protein
LFPKAERCGVYILTFANGERFVGQSVDVVARFGTHRRTWVDIECLDFCPTLRTGLDALERAMITGQRVAGYRLRNITHSLGPLGESDLDPIVTPSEQYDWLNDDGAQLHDAQDRADERSGTVARELRRDHRRCHRRHQSLPRNP